MIEVLGTDEFEQWFLALDDSDGEVEAIWVQYLWDINASA